MRYTLRVHSTTIGVVQAASLQAHSANTTDHLEFEGGLGSLSDAAT